MKKNIKELKKQVMYKCLYSGTKETDLLYQNKIINKIDILTYDDLTKLIELFSLYSDHELFLFLTNKKELPINFEKILSKLKL